MEERSKLLKPDHLEQEEYKVELDISAGQENPRLKVDIPCTKAVIEITETKPPFLVIVCRADNEIMAYGLLEKAKQAIQFFQSKINPVSKLLKGVREMLPAFTKR